MAALWARSKARSQSCRRKVEIKIFEEDYKMRRVIRFWETNKMAYKKLNEWLAEHPQVILVDIKPVVIGSSSRTEIVYAIVDIPQNENQSGVESETKD